MSDDTSERNYQDTYELALAAKETLLQNGFEITKDIYKHSRSCNPSENTRRWRNDV